MGNWAQAAGSCGLAVRLQGWMGAMLGAVGRLVLFFEGSGPQWITGLKLRAVGSGWVGWRRACGGGRFPDSRLESEGGPNSGPNPITESGSESEARIREAMYKFRIPHSKA